jgi:hypothetical protein
LTDFTPFTVRATDEAVAIFSAELTKPLSCTTPLNVSTLISETFRVGAFRIAALTPVVIAASSMYCPVV